MTGEADFKSERCEIRVSIEQIERSRETELKLVAIEGHSLDLLEDLGEIDGGAMDFCGDVGEGPAAGEVGGEEELDAIDHALVAIGASGVPASARPESALDESYCQALGF